MNGPTREDSPDLLSRMLSQAGFEMAEDHDLPLTRRELTGPSPAGFAQELVWLLDRAAPGNTAYNMTVARRARGRLDVPALRKSLQEVGSPGTELEFAL